MPKDKLIFAKDIPTDTTLEDLKLTKENWVNQARENGYPDMIWTIVRWLGKASEEQKPGMKNFIFQFANIKIYGNEYVDRYGVQEEAYISDRKIHVWVDENYVMTWEWEVTPDGNKAEVIETSLFVPGQWLEKLLVHVGPAQAAEAAYNASLTDDERQRLMKQLLIGVQL